MNQFDTPQQRKQNTSLFGTLFGFIILLFAGSFIQTVPIYAVVYRMLYPWMNEMTEKMLSGSITVEEAMPLMEKTVYAISEHPICLVASLVGTMGIIGVCLYWCWGVQRRPLSFMGIRKEKAVPHYLLGIAVGFVMFAAAIGISVLSGAATVSRAKEFSWAYIGLFFFGFLIQGLEEELLLRGYLMNSLRGRMSRFGAVMLSSLMFGLLHMGNQGITFLALANLTLFGIFAGIYFMRTNSIWGVAAIHSVWNFVQGNFWGCSVSGMPLYDSIFVTTMAPDRATTNGGAFGPEGGLGVTIVLTVGIFLLLWSAIPSEKKKQKT